jgi:hypothetical protein
MSQNFGKSAIVPFGKYKGQPVDVMAMDDNYVEWCLSQGDIREKYPDFVSIIINNFQEPAETPEHNKMQALFLDDDFVKKFLIASGFDVFQKYGFLDEINNSCEFEVINYNRKHVVTFEQRERNYTYDVCVYLKENEICKLKCKDIERIKLRLFDEMGIKYETVKAFNENMEYHYFIELKPVLSDDYPAVLRKLPSGSVLIIDLFKTNSITLDQLKQIFITKKIKVIMLKDILNIKKEVE